MIEFETKEDMPRKVLIYGEDGTGKSTFAAKYCEKHGLKAVVVDVDKTNFTDVPSVKIDLSNHIKATRNMESLIRELTDNNDYDTIIIDGIDSLLANLESNDSGLARYNARAKNFQKILNSLLASNLNLIMIGQIILKVVENNEVQPNKQFVKINSFVNEKYKTVRTGSNIDNFKYSYETEKFRSNI